MTKHDMTWHDIAVLCCCFQSVSGARLLSFPNLGQVFSDNETLQHMNLTNVLAFIQNITYNLRTKLINLLCSKSNHLFKTDEANNSFINRSFTYNRTISS